MSQAKVELLSDQGKLRVRDAMFDDFSTIQALLDYSKNHHFGSLCQRKCDSADCFFKHYVTHRLLVFHDSADKINVAIGYAEFANFPCIDPLPKDCWPQWLSHHYCTQLPLSTANTLFFNYFVYDNEHVPDVLLSVLRECFLREQKLRYILTVEVPEPPSEPINSKPPEQQQYYVLEQYTKIFYPREYNVATCKNVQHVHIIFRDNIVYNLRYRLALPEDNDDCVEIIDKERPEMRQELGDFYIAEQLLNTDKTDDCIIITEIANSTAGFMWLNEKVDVIFLASNWELDDFGYLLKFTPTQNFKQLIFPTSVLVKKVPATLYTTDFVQKIVSRKNCKGTAMLNNPSTNSICSKFIFQIISNSGIIETTNEEFYTRMSTIKRMQVIDELFHNIEYYVGIHTKYIRINVNVPDNYTDDEFNNTKNIDIASNAFTLRLFGLHDFVDLRRVQQFIATAFNAFDRDYCVLFIQRSTPMSKPMLELLKYFVRIPPRANCQSEDALYLTYRGAVYGDLTVHPVSDCDVNDIESLLLQLEHKSPYKTPVNKSSVTSLFVDRAEQDTAAANEISMVRAILNEVLQDPQNTNYVFRTIRCGNAARPVHESVIVGYVVIRRFSDTHLLNRHFWVAHYNYSLDEAIAEVVTLKLHPCFHFQVDAVFRELARQSEFWKFVYISPVRSNFVPLTNDVLHNMQPVEPRRIKREHYYRTTLMEEDDDGPTNYVDGNFAVFHINLFPTRVFGNVESIVIIGFTDTTKAFLRSLIFSWNSSTDMEYTKSYCCLTRLKVLVIAEPGVVEAEYDDYFRCGLCSNHADCWINFQNCNAFIRDATKRIDLRVWVEFLDGNVMAIDTDNRTVHLSNGCAIYYATLLIFNDTEYGPPVPMTWSDVNVMPTNYAVINSRLDKINLFHKLQLLLESQEDSKILVYGSHIHCFEFINFLVQHNCKGSTITLVIPYLWRNTRAENIINNPCVDERVEIILLEMVEDLGVVTYDAYNFSHWTRYPEDESIQSVTFKKNVTGELIEVSCQMFVSFKESYIDTHFAQMLKDSGIDMNNNNILVDEDYHTSAPNVYALGKYMEHTELPNHQYIHVSPRESSEQLINILNLSPLKQENPLDRKFKQPHYFQAQLPMGHFLTNCILPKRYLANHLSNSYGLPMTTYSGDFCRVRLNDKGIVEQILCVSKKNMCLDFLQYFVGKHEALLNNLRPHWFLDEIDCFLDFFQQPWTQLITHDLFEKFQAETRDTIYSTAQEFMILGLERNHRKILLQRYLNDLNVTTEIQGKLLEFLRRHRSDFPHPFALPEDFFDIK